MEKTYHLSWFPVRVYGKPLRTGGTITTTFHGDERELEAELTRLSLANSGTSIQVQEVD